MERPIFKYVRTKLLIRKLHCSFAPLTSGVQNCGRMLEQIIQCLVFVVGPRVSPSPDVIHVMNETRPVIVNGNEK